MIKSLLHSIRLSGLAMLAAALPLLARGAELVVVTVNNGHMIALQKVSAEFERMRPDVRLRWVVLEEGPLRQQLTRDIATGAGHYDVMTIGAYEAPIWGRRGWLKPIEPTKAYDADDLLPPIRQALTVDGRLYALPFYGESSMTLVRTDLLKAAGIALPAQPSWEQIRQAARQLHAPDKGTYGICLRGKPGWGENITVVTTMVNTHGGQWFDLNWKPQIDTPPWHAAVSLYAELLTQYGPPGAVANGYNENLALFMAGRCAIWVDATVAGSFVNRPDASRVAGKVAFLQAPTATTTKGSHWLWTWAMAIPATSQKAEAAQAFIEWATSKDYVDIVARDLGWNAVPSGTRTSTYKQGPFQRSNRHAEVERQAIATADPRDATLPRSPYVGVQYAAIPEFQSIGTAVGQLLGQVLQSELTVDEALRKAQSLTEGKMRAAGYYGKPAAPARSAQTEQGVDGSPAKHPVKARKPAKRPPRAPGASQPKR
ncbi:MAG: sugar ABC transporter substrate-binding protein [Aquabacterium sp.]